jgi:hypothetical protein
LSSRLPNVEGVLTNFLRAILVLTLLAKFTLTPFIMKVVTIKVHVKKYKFFMELMAQLDFVEVNDEQYPIPAFHKDLVKERLEVYKSEEQFNWEDVKDKFDLNDGLLSHTYS